MDRLLSLCVLDILHLQSVESSCTSAVLTAVIQFETDMTIFYRKLALVDAEDAEPTDVATGDVLCRAESFYANAAESA